MIISSLSFGQKVYQSGFYARQKMRPGSKVIKGMLIDKFINNGYFWYSIVDHDKIYRISVMKSDFDNAEVESNVILSNCFAISSQKWRCVTPKKKSTFMQRNVFYANTAARKEK